MRNRWRLPPVFGPLFGYDLVAATRRGQHSGLRVLVAFLLLATLYVVYTMKVRGFDPFINPFESGPRIDPKDMAEFAKTFFEWCMIVQFAAVILITPIVVADAIAREKERRALDFLFVTALTDHEIILGKLSSRLAYMGGVVLTGLPILGLTQLFGGVEPELLLSSYAGLLSTLASLGALSLYCSVVSNTALQATVRSYVAAAGYLMVGSCLIFPLVTSSFAIWGMIVFAVINLAFATVFVVVSVHDLRPRAELLPPLPAALLPNLAKPARRKRPPRVIAVTSADETGKEEEFLPYVLPATAESYKDVLPADVGWNPADWRKLDRTAVWEPPELPRPPLPPVDDRRPLLWKEIHLHSIIGSAPGGPTAIGVLLVMATAFAGLLWLLIAVSATGGAEIAAFGTGLARVGTIAIGGLLGLGAIVHSVNSVSKERERDTLDALLALPVTRDTILAVKWLGGLVSLRVMIMALAAVWAFGLLTGGLHPVAVFVLAVSVAAVVEFLASLGLWLSVMCATSLRANMAAVLSLLLVASGPYIISNYVEMLHPYSGRHAAAADLISEVSMPFVAWWQACVGWQQYDKLPEGYFPTILLGALAYAATAWLLWRTALGRFRQYGGKRG
jgi:ABC-type transport system involved in multi-copper enzyme maturation permease subunit